MYLMKSFCLVVMSRRVAAWKPGACGVLDALQDSRFGVCVPADRVIGDRRWPQALQPK